MGSSAALPQPCSAAGASLLSIFPCIAHLPWESGVAGLAVPSSIPETCQRTELWEAALGWDLSSVPPLLGVRLSHCPWEET